MNMLKRFFPLVAIGVLFISGCGTSPAVESTQNSAALNQPVTDVANLVVPAPTSPATIDASAPVVTSIPSNIINPNSKSAMLTFNQAKHYFATLKTTKGDITIALNFGQTPNTVKNFVDLAQKNFYDNTIFHRVMKGFMIQGGDPNGNGTGGPGYKFADEPFTGEYSRGTVAMANSGANTNGSQFFIMHADYPLPKNYIIFGQVTKGLDVVDAIANSPVTMSDSGEDSKPVEPTIVKSVSVKEE